MSAQVDTVSDTELPIGGKIMLYWSSLQEEVLKVPRGTKHRGHNCNWTEGYPSMP